MYNKLVKVAFSGVIEQAESEEEKEVVVYGLVAIVSSIVNILSMILIGIISDNFLATVIYLLCFCSIRVFAGGFHANTYLSCFLCSVFVYSFTVMLNTYITLENSKIVIITAGISYVLILLIAPVLNGKRKFTVDEIQMTKKRVVFILLAQLLITIVLYQVDFELFKFALYAIITEGVFGTMGKIKYRKFNKQEWLKKIMRLSLGAAVLSGWFPCFSAFYEPEIPKALKDKLENK